MISRLGSAIRRIGIIPQIILASVLAIFVSVLVVQFWTLHVVTQAELRSAQSSLDVNLKLLKDEMRRRGADWRLAEGGGLTIDGKPAEGLDQIVDEVSRITGGVATLFAGDTRIATTVRQPDGTRAIGTKLAEGPARDTVIGLDQVYRGMANILGVPHLTVYEPLHDAAGRQIGLMFVGVPFEEAEALIARIVRQSVLAGTIVILIVALGGWLFLRAALRPLQTLESAVNVISDGNLEILVPCLDRTDQLGGIGRAVDGLRVKAQRARALEQKMAADQAAKMKRQVAMDRLTQEFGTSVSGVLGTLGQSANEAREAASEMAQAAERTHGDMVTTVSDADLSSQNLSTVSAAAEELTASVGEISRQVGEAALAAREAVQQAEATDTTVRSLSQAASQIGEVVSLINTIAGQTNLLALNATIEAARAGDAGKGFAVVASEVKQLANQTAQATRQIGAQVTAIQTATAEAADAVRGVTDAIGRVGEVATAIAAAVEQQGAATREIAAQVQSVAHNTAQSTQAMRDVATAAKRSGAISQAVLASADQVGEVSGTLREEVDHFLTAMRDTERTGDRRQYERISGNGHVARVNCAKLGTASAPIIDISLGGAQLSCGWLCELGRLITLELPGVEGEVPGRVVHARDNMLHVAFRLDPATLVRVGRAMELIGGKSAQDRPAAA